MARWFTEEDVRRLIEEAVAPLMARIAELEAENERLKAEIAKLKRNSTTSSKPPSSDIVKPPRPPKSGGKRGKRRAGGQPGHTRHTRPAFPPEQVDQIREYELPTVPPGWRPLDQFRVVQQVELVEKPYTVTEAPPKPRNFLDLSGQPRRTTCNHAGGKLENSPPRVSRYPTLPANA
jgi:hypothetical protein